MEALPLVGLIEIGQRGCVQRPVVTMWRTRHPDFPQPVAVQAVGPVFWGPEIDAWLERTGRAHPPEQQWTRKQVTGKHGYGGPK
jgi:hypothetical protein